MRYHMILVLFVSSYAQAQTFSPSGFRDAVNAEQNSRSQVAAVGESNNSDDMLLALLKSAKTNAKALDEKRTIYGIKIGSKSSSLTLRTEMEPAFKTNIPGVVRHLVNLNQSKLDRPVPLTRGDEGWIFVLVDTSADTIVGVGLATFNSDVQFGRDMRASIIAKCDSYKHFQASELQGSPPDRRPRLGEIVGTTKDGLIMTFTDKKVVADTTGDIMRLTYIDQDLANNAFAKGVEASGF